MKILIYLCTWKEIPYSENDFEGIDLGHREDPALTVRNKQNYSYAFDKL